MLTNLGNSWNEGPFGLVPLSLLKNIPVFVELRKVVSNIYEIYEGLRQNLRNIAGPQRNYLIG